MPTLAQLELLIGTLYSIIITAEILDIGSWSSISRVRLVGFHFILFYSS